MECILWPSQVMGRLGYICFCMGLITQWTIRSSLITGGGEGSETYKRGCAGEQGMVFGVLSLINYSTSMLDTRW